MPVGRAYVPSRALDAAAFRERAPSLLDVLAQAAIPRPAGQRFSLVFTLAVVVIRVPGDAGLPAGAVPASASHAADVRPASAVNPRKSTPLIAEGLVTTRLGEVLWRVCWIGVT